MNVILLSARTLCDGGGWWW